MLEIGLFHNGASSLPVITNKSGVTFNDGTLAEVHQAAQETLVNQVRQGILAEKLGFIAVFGRQNLGEHRLGGDAAGQRLLLSIQVPCSLRMAANASSPSSISWGEARPARLSCTEFSLSRLEP
jgi:hypothetical protein